MNTELIQKKLDQELELAHSADKETNDILQSRFLDKVMANIEAIREKRFKESQKYTKKYLAESAGIALSTYYNYLSGTSYDITLMTVWRMTQTLNCKFSDILDSAVKETGKI